MPDGFAASARKLVWRCTQALRLQLTGVQLEDRSDEMSLDNGSAEQLPGVAEGYAASAFGAGAGLG